LHDLDSEPQYLIHTDPRELEEASRAFPKPVKTTVTPHSVGQGNNFSEENHGKSYNQSSFGQTVPVKSNIRQAASETNVVDQDTIKTSGAMKSQGSGRKHQPLNIKLGPDDEENLKKTDLLTLKKQVIEEIKSEMQLQGQGKLPGSAGISRPGYVDPFSRLDMHSHKDTEKEGDQITLVGGASRDGDPDESSQIIINTRKARA